MLQETIYVILSVVLVSLISLIGVLSLALRKKTLNALLLVLVSLSAGTLLGGAFLHLLPEAVAEQGFNLSVSLLVLAGILTFFIIEKFIHLHRCEVPHAHHHFEMLHEKHPHHIGTINLIGDGLHNFLDGLVIAGAYLVNIPVGISTTVAVVLHEIPQELADFGILLYAGYNKKKAILFNFLSATVAIVGAIAGLILGAKGKFFIDFILPFAAGGFIYIAGSNLIPELHKHCELKESIKHLLALIVGIALMIVLLFL